SLGDVQRFGVREAAEIEPRSIFEPDRFDDERVAVPAADRITHERWVRIRWELSPVEEDLPVGELLRQDHDEFRRLHDLRGNWRKEVHARTLRQAAEIRRVVLTKPLDALCDQLTRPRRDVIGFQIGSDCPDVTTRLPSPYAGEIWCAVGHAR